MRNETRKIRKGNWTGMLEGNEDSRWGVLLLSVAMKDKHVISIIKKATIFCRWNCLHPADQITQR
jgi:hypothetical protein